MLSLKTRRRDGNPRRMAPAFLAGLLLLLWLLPPGWALSTAELREGLAGYLAHGALRGAENACVVWDLESDAEILSVQPGRPLIPASEVKLLISGTALELMGPEAAFKTEVWAEAEPDTAGRLLGPLYLVGTADPQAGAGVFAVLARTLHEKGLRRVEGDVICGTPVLLGDRDHGLNGAQRLHQALGAQGISVNGEPREGAAGSAPVLLARHTSVTLAEYLRRMNKQSLNHEADRLLGSLLAGYYDPAHRDPDFILRYWSNRGLPTTGLRLVDGSGYSRDNRLSAGLLAGMLSRAARDPQTYRVLSRSLPVAGQDGTLAGRMRGTPAAGRVRAKTGTLPRVSCLAGYVQVGEEGRAAFALLMNGFSCSTETARRIQDQMAVLITRWALESGREDA